MKRVRPAVQERIESRLRTAFDKAIKDSDFSKLEELMVDITSEEKGIAIVRTNTKLSVEAILYANDSRGAPPPNWRNAPGNCRLLIEEMLVRSITVEEDCINDSWPYFRDIISSSSRVQKDLSEMKGDVNAEPDLDSTLGLFRRLYEINLKAIQILVRLTDAIEGKTQKSYTRKRAFKRLRTFEDGRYQILLPSETMTIMRDAISHESVAFDGPNGLAIFRSDHGTRRLKPKTVDKNVSELFSRILVFMECTNLATAYSAKMNEVAAIARIRERDRILSKLRKDKKTKK